MSACWASSFLSCKSAALLYSPLQRARIPVAISHGAFHRCRRQMGFVAINHRHQFQLLCSGNGHEIAPEMGSEEADSLGKDNHQKESLTTSEVLKRLKRYGTSGVLSYGLLNTAYYLSTFLFVWLYVAPVPGKMGYVGAAERLLKVLAMVWAGSQVTKLIRAGGALAMAPAVDRGLSWFTKKFKFESQGKAFMAIAGFCFGLAFVVFVVLTLLWA